MTPLEMCGHIEESVYLKNQDSTIDQERFMRMGKVKEEMVGRQSQICTRPHTVSIPSTIRQECK